MTAQLTKISSSLTFFLQIFHKLVDEVLEGDDYLLIWNKGKEYKLLFADIVNINYQPSLNFSKVTLSLNEENPLGRKIHFIAPIRSRRAFLSQDTFVEDLIKRINNAQN